MVSADNLDAARAKVIEIAKLDVLSETQALVNESKRKEIARTFISDTITVPTKEMYEYAVQSTLGDDVYFEPSTAALEQHCAKICGKEAACFMPSGSASNQIALRAHFRQPPYSVMVDHRAHIYKYEAGGAGFHSGAAVTAVVPSNAHHLTLEDVQENMIYGPDSHFAPTEVIALENTLNGTIIPQEEVIKIADFGHANGVKMHLDGARIWHVAVELGVPLSELCAPFDSISMCFSKGLGAPVGSCLVGSKEFVDRARRLRKLFGGGMRQTGILAASAAYALTYHLGRLPAVHALAKKLENGLKEIGASITGPAETCMLFYDPSPLGLTYDEIGNRAANLPEPLILGGSRVVVHIQTSEAAIDDLLGLIREMAEEKIKEGWVRPEGQANGTKMKDIYVRRSAGASK